MNTNAIAQRVLSIAAAAMLTTGWMHSSAGSASGVQATPTYRPNAIALAQSESTSLTLLDDDLIAEFRERVAKYMKLHDKIQTQGARQTTQAAVGENLVSRQALATRLRFARYDARPGDLFTPRIAMTFRKAMGPALRGFTAEWLRESIGEDVPETFVLVVNGSYPDGAPRSTMPVTLLKILPPLPKDLEYRIVDSHLILLDVDANIVVDYMLDVICKTC
jgi:hypothetical protein